MASRFDEYTAEELADRLGASMTPEPMPVILAYETCPVHTGYHFISMPRNNGEQYFGLDYKCPIRACEYGK